jgi:hypothetical protein
MVDVKIGDLAAGKMTTKKVTLRRTETDDLGTFGVLTLPSGTQLYSGELPWRGNKVGKSCIPAGTYNCTWTTTARHPDGVYEVQDVKGRTAVQIHLGNWCGDADKDLKSNVEGCILPGRAIDEIAGQKAVKGSADALKTLVAELEHLPFQLVIEWGATVPREAYS